MAEAFKKSPGRGGDFDAILKHLYANFVVAKVEGEVKRMFPGVCLKCKNETVPYRITATCKSPADIPTGDLSWHCTHDNQDFLFIGDRDIIIGRMAALWEQKL